MSQKITYSRTFVAPVVFAQPSFRELEQRFPGYLDERIRGAKFKRVYTRKSALDESCAPLTTFRLVGFPSEPSMFEVLTAIAGKGLRPAFYEELLGFDEKYPEQRGHGTLVAFGSVAFITDEYEQRVAVATIDGDYDSATFDHAYLDDFNMNCCRFLAVRE